MASTLCVLVSAKRMNFGQTGMRIDEKSKKYVSSRGKKWDDGRGKFVKFDLLWILFFAVWATVFEQNMNELRRMIFHIKNNNSRVFHFVITYDFFEKIKMLCSLFSYKM